ncbi:hypothetical protein [Zhongshania aliphaticivorans]|uniref:hypothetical protein n=1 Tax=Zhongshania aliphaticivorans TaxID=1470434 RepID=UPI0012E6DAC5|nr:hypothetical protein [Zhongshania aliphaticivorans]CAA0103272.1 Uncharacterised protein [Zhongshania aliphaticivorans]
MLVDKYNHLMRCAKAERVPLVPYLCPDCNADLLALQPPLEDDPWDSVVQCPHCLGLHFRLVSFDGEIGIWSLSK